MQAFDLGAVMAVERGAYALPWSERVMADCLAGDYRCEVASGADGLAGHMVSQLVLDELHLLNLCVAREQQRRGVGLSLMQHLLDGGRRDGAATVFLEVRASNRAAQALYGGLGFDKLATRRGYYRGESGGEDAIVMALPLR